MNSIRYSLLLGGSFLAFASTALAGIRAGVESVGNSGTIPPSTPAPAATGNVVINFDDQAQPFLFFDTVALRDEYAALGVTFSGAGPLDGGAILDQASSFSVSGYSAPNFLAFNCEATLSDGGHPDAPETLTFSSLVSFVRINVGSGLDTGISLSMEAYDDNAQLVAVNSVVVQPELQPLAVAAFGIRYVVIGAQSHPCTWVGDDLTFEVGTVSVDPVSWGEAKARYR